MKGGATPEGIFEGSETFDVPVGVYDVYVYVYSGYWDDALQQWIATMYTTFTLGNVEVESVAPTAADEQAAPVVYSINGTVYASESFVIYDLAGRDVTSFNGMLEGMYIVELEGGLKVKVLTE